MRMRLEHYGSGANHFSTLRVLCNPARTPDQTGDGEQARCLLVAGRAAEQFVGFRPRRLPPTARLFGQTNRREKGTACGPANRMSKERAKGLHRGLVESRQKSGQGGAMRQLISTKQGHERRSKGSKPFVKGQQRRLTGKDVANQHCTKIEKTRSGQSVREQSAPHPGWFSAGPYA
jgi:hypothetical protein